MRPGRARHDRAVTGGRRWLLPLRLLTWLFTVSVAALVLAAVVVPRLAGATPYTVLTGSMTPAYPPGSLVVVRPVEPNEVRIGDVVTYQLRSGEPAVATHRVVGVGWSADGERLLTDLRHLGQLLHEAALREQLGLTGVLAWLREESRGSAERPRRLDSDAAAVQIGTVHGSKGLQYPVTYLPFAFQKFPFPSQVARYHEGGERMLDVSGQGEQWSRREALHKAEEAGEELRDLYVALTRAQSQVVTWWAPTANTRHGGLHRLLFGRQPGTAEVPDVQEPREDEYAERVMGLLFELFCAGDAAEMDRPPKRSSDDAADGAEAA